MASFNRGRLVFDYLHFHSNPVLVFPFLPQMDTIVNPLKSSVRNVGNIVRSMPNNFADGVARVSGGFRNIPNNMLDGVGKMLNVKGVSTQLHVLESLVDNKLSVL